MPGVYEHAQIHHHCKLWCSSEVQVLHLRVWGAICTEIAMLWHAAGFHPILKQDRTRSICFSEGITFLHWNLSNKDMLQTFWPSHASTFPSLQLEVLQAKNIWIFPIRLFGLLGFLCLPEGSVPLVPHYQQMIKLFHPIKWTPYNKQTIDVHFHYGTVCRALIHIKYAPNLNFSLEKIMRCKVFINACIQI